MRFVVVCEDWAGGGELELVATGGGRIGSARSSRDRFRV